MSPFEPSSPPLRQRPHRDTVFSRPRLRHAPEPDDTAR